VAKERPAWGFALVDLRGHARSFPAPAPPHTLAGMAADLVATEDAVPGPIKGVMGHSLGGKVALAYARERGLDQTWVFDSQPGRYEARASHVTAEVFRMLQKLPARFARRDEFVEAVLADGKSEMLARWLAMNVKREGEAFRLQLDLPAIGAILEDYAAQDYWPDLERAPSGERHLVVGTKSTVWVEGDESRLARVEQSNATTVHRLEGGHWIHMEAGDALRARIVAALP
ncbi:MAG: alpha/beta hydrolase, partial [Myxococcota bacterium]